MPFATREHTQDVKHKHFVHTHTHNDQQIRLASNNSSSVGVGGGAGDAHSPIACLQDDPLSSLDNEVARFVFDHGIRRMLARQKRTAIVVTQRLQLAFRADNVSYSRAMMGVVHDVRMRWNSDCWQFYVFVAYGRSLAVVD